MSDLDTGHEVWRVLYELAQDIGMRLRENKLSAQGVQISIEDNELNQSFYRSLTHVDGITVVNTNVMN